MVTRDHADEPHEVEKQQLSASISNAFKSDVWNELARVAVDADVNDVPGVRDAQLPLLALPAESLVPSPDSPKRVLIAVEGTDRRMAKMIASLLEPASVTLALVHVTWVPGIASSPLPVEGIDNPRPTDLLLYRDANDALICTAEALRDAGFSVTTHLRENRHPAEAIVSYVARSRPHLVVLGRGRHGAGIANDLLKQAHVPILFVEAR